MRRLSLNARSMQDAPTTSEVFAVLLRFEHPELEAPILLSTDCTERISSEPLVYGTRSTWRGANPITEPHLWVVASALVPSDLEDAPASAQIALENLDRRIVELVNSFTSPATVHMAVVLADTPDLIEQEWSDLLMVSSDKDVGEIVIAVSREEIEQEFYPAGRMTRDRFPGLQL